MFKKTLVTLLALCLVMAGAALAAQEEEILTPEDIVYDAARYIEDAQYDLTEDSDIKVRMQNQFAHRRFQAVREMAGRNREQLGEVLDDLVEHERELGRLIEGTTNEDIIQLVAEASQKRGQNLLLMSEDETLPEEARQGMLRALANQEKAMERFRQAMERAGLNREQGKDNDDGEEVSQQPGNSVTVPVETPKTPQGNR